MHWAPARTMPTCLALHCGLCIILYTQQQQPWTENWPWSPLHADVPASQFPLTAEAFVTNTSVSLFKDTAGRTSIPPGTYQVEPLLATLCKHMQAEFVGP